MITEYKEKTRLKSYTIHGCFIKEEQIEPFQKVHISTRHVMSSQACQEPIYPIIAFISLSFAAIARR